MLFRVIPWLAELVLGEQEGFCSLSFSPQNLLLPSATETFSLDPSCTSSCVPAADKPHVNWCFPSRAWLHAGSSYTSGTDPCAGNCLLEKHWAHTGPGRNVFWIFFIAQSLTFILANVGHMMCLDEGANSMFFFLVSKRCRPLRRQLSCAASWTCQLIFVGYSRGLEHLHFQLGGLKMELCGDSHAGQGWHNWPWLCPGLQAMSQGGITCITHHEWSWGLAALENLWLWTNLGARPYMKKYFMSHFSVRLLLDPSPRSQGKGCSFGSGFSWIPPSNPGSSREGQHSWSWGSGQRWDGLFRALCFQSLRHKLL